MPAEWPVPEELLREEAERISARYRVSPEDALAALAETFARRTGLAKRIRERHGREDVTRWRDYREAVRECRKKIYYGLRRYYPADESPDRLVEEFVRETDGPARPVRIDEMRLRLLALHTSTRERSGHYAEFYERFFELMGAPATLLDIGCGMHPLSYPFEGAGSATRRYVALDRDARAIRAVAAYARLVGPDRLVVVQARLEELNWADEVFSADPFDFAQGRPFDFAQGRPFDPAQDKPLDVAQGRPFDPAQGRPFDFAQGRPFDFAQGRPFDFAQGRPFDFAQGRPFDFAQGRPFDPAQGRPFDPAQGRPFDPAQGRPFDLAVMLKVVPVLARLDKSALGRLHSVPAGRVFLTGSAASMTRRQNIERREQVVLKRFIEESGRRIVGEFSVANEFGYLLE